MSTEKIDGSLGRTCPDHWRYLWDSRRREDDGDNNNNVLDQLDRHAKPLPEGLRVMTAEEWGRTEFLCLTGALLKGHYVEEDYFRFCLHDDFLSWAVDSPLCDSSLLVGIIAEAPDDATASGDGSSRELLAVAIAMPLVLHHESLGYSVKDQVDHSANDAVVRPRFAMVDFVCINRSHRGRRLCPFLYAEVTRRCNASGIHHLICTSGDNLAFPVSSARYHHWLNAEQLPKLVDIGFAVKPANLTMAAFQQRLRLRDEPILKLPIPLRSMCESDVAALRKAYNLSAVKNHKIAVLFPRDEDFSHTFLPRRSIIETYVVDGTTDFMSFYINETGIVGGKCTGAVLRQAYVYYCVSDTVPRRNLLLAATHHLLQKYKEDNDNTEANSSAIDTVNCLGGIMGNSDCMLKSAGFGPGTGILKYYQLNAPPGALLPEDIAWLTT
eukprot:CAMPEP_0197451448 /NCGR_PEP_ID=MMETSP1175-20131217/28905_1 /TAXON_ID=1003142 /ORGANISM="Triceratium dubium, Strain CCMP147" /LENGTH=438 /DNA_ID=CAMNT_0042984167 /DNA_START=12 /DNA_END=1328 /DNA_ORIENTATION=-